MKDPFCAGSPHARAMTDDEFWDAVFDDGKTDEERATEEADHYEDIRREFDRESDPEADLNGYRLLSGEGEVVGYLLPSDICPICGAARACAYDAEGRPMIHSPEI